MGFKKILKFTLTTLLLIAVFCGIIFIILFFFSHHERFDKEIDQIEKITYSRSHIFCDDSIGESICFDTPDEIKWVTKQISKIPFIPTKNKFLFCDIPSMELVVFYKDGRTLLISVLGNQTKMIMHKKDPNGHFRYGQALEYYHYYTSCHYMRYLIESN